MGRELRETNFFLNFFFTVPTTIELEGEGGKVRRRKKKEKKLFSSPLILLWESPGPAPAG